MVDPFVSVLFLGDIFFESLHAFLIDFDLFQFLPNQGFELLVESMDGVASFFELVLEFVLDVCLHNILLRFILFLLFSLLAFISNNQWTSFFFHLSFQISTSSSSTLYSYFLPPSVFPPPKQHQRSLHNKHPLLPAREIKIREI